MFKAPTQTPHILTLLDDMATRDLRKIARHLGVTENTVKRWAKTGNAPRMAHLALFWESRWGLSVLDVDIWNRESLRLGHIRALTDENTQLKAQLARLVELGHHGAANDPLWGVNCERTGAAGTITGRQLPAVPASGVELIQQLHANPPGYLIPPAAAQGAQVAAQAVTDGQLAG